MMEKIKVAVVGYGNIGKYALEAIASASDMECVGVVRRNGSSEGFPELAKYKVCSDISELGKVDVAILSTPSRKVEENAVKYLRMGMNTVDSFDIHTGIPELRAKLDKVAKENGSVSVIAAGWDPGSDSMVRAIMESLAPKGVTFTNFGPGKSMGHTVVVKEIEGVRDAMSMTVPMGTGLHRRIVYVELEEGANLSDVESVLKNDPYFSSDETTLIQVDDLDAVNTVSHGVNITRTGVSGRTHNQLLEYNMKINNPALTGQFLVSAARASMRQKSGCYTTIEIAPVDFLAGDREDLIKRLV